MSLEQLSSVMLPAIEAELQRQVDKARQPGTEAFHEMLAYHMGWAAGTGAEAGASGKRIRPLLTLLVVEASGSQWLHAVSAAAAVELIHNFSLVHDDIEDNSPTRRGRSTVWNIHGVPMAINVGDAIFSIAGQSILDIRPNYPAETVLHAASCLQNACLELTCGQYLDMSFERQAGLPEQRYWSMIAGKTAALLSAAAQIGAILGFADGPALQNYTDFARCLGLAFQVQDDILGIWGDEAKTGKSAASDLVEGKNSLPILYGLNHSPQFAKRWAAGPIAAEETPTLAQHLKESGALAYCTREA